MAITTTIEVITPELAKEMLEHSAPNRTIRAKEVDKLKRDIVDGNFHLTHQGIAFNERGELIDGQHRLTAVFLAQKPVTMMVTRGITDESAGAIDRGVKRTIIDSMTIMGAYDKPWYRSTNVIAAIRGVVRFGYNGKYVLSDSEIERFFNTFPKEVESLYNIIGSGADLSAGINAALFSALICGESMQDLRYFVKVFRYNDLSQADRYNVQIVSNFAKQILEKKARHERANADELYKIAQNTIYSFVHRLNVRIAKKTDKIRYDVYDKIKEVMEG